MTPASATGLEQAGVSVTADAEFERLVALGMPEAEANAAWLSGTASVNLTPFALRGLAHSFGLLIDRLSDGEGAVAWPTRRANVPYHGSETTRLVGFVIEKGDEAFGEYGLSEPLAWLDRMCVTHPAPVAAQPVDDVQALLETLDGGVQATGGQSEDGTELFHVEDAGEAMVDAARLIRKLLASSPTPPTAPAVPAGVRALRQSSPPDGQTADGWIEWKGGPQPLPDNALIYWKLWQNGKNVECGPGYPLGLVWTHGPDGPRFNDITAYRLAIPTPSSETKAPGEEH